VAWLLIFEKVSILTTFKHFQATNTPKHYVKIICKMCERFYLWTHPPILLKIKVDFFVEQKIYFQVYGWKLCP